MDANVIKSKIDLFWETTIELGGMLNERIPRATKIEIADIMPSVKASEMKLINKIYEDGCPITVISELTKSDMKKLLSCNGTDLEVQKSWVYCGDITIKEFLEKYWKPFKEAQKPEKEDDQKIKEAVEKMNKILDNLDLEKEYDFITTLKDFLDFSSGKMEDPNIEVR